MWILKAVVISKKYNSFYKQLIIKTCEQIKSNCFSPFLNHTQKKVQWGLKVISTNVAFFIL